MHHNLVAVGCFLGANLDTIDQCPGPLALDEPPLERFSAEVAGGQSQHLFDIDRVAFE